MACSTSLRDVYVEGTKTLFKRSCTSHTPSSQFVELDHAISAGSDLRKRIMAFERVIFNMACLMSIKHAAACIKGTSTFLQHTTTSRMPLETSHIVELENIISAG